MHAVRPHQHHLLKAAAKPVWNGSSTPPPPASTTPTSKGDSTSPPLKEADAYPAMPEDGYGWEKLFSERMCRHFREDFGLDTRVARFHNVYGPYGTWDGGREKAPAAICRKVIQAKPTATTRSKSGATVKQTRSFMYIDDCVMGIDRIMNSEVEEPINLGSNELVTINGLVDIVEEIAGVKLEDLQSRCPQGRQRSQQRQHQDPELFRLGAEHPTARRDGEDLPLDLRRVHGPPTSTCGNRVAVREKAPFLKNLNDA